MINYSSDEIIQIFKEFHRLGSPLDIEADSSVNLNKDTTIENWRRSGDLMGWRKLAKALNHEFEINIHIDRWEEVLEPSKTRTLKGVCLLVSQEAIKRNIRPIKLLGVQCKSASTFRFIKEELNRNGAMVEGLKPSSSMKDYLSSDYSAMMSIIARLRSGAIDKLELVKKEKKRSIWHSLNIFNLNKYEVVPVGVTTFRDYIMKII